MHFPLSFNTFFFFLLFFFWFLLSSITQQWKKRWKQQNSKLHFDFNELFIPAIWLFFFTFITFIGSCEKLQIINDNRSKNQNNFSVSMKKFPLTAIKKKKKKNSNLFYCRFFFLQKKEKKSLWCQLKSSYLNYSALCN